MSPGFGGSAPSQPPRSLPATAGARGGPPPQILDPQCLAELVLTCVHAEGVDLPSISAAKRALAFSVDLSYGRWVVTVGRQHQPEFFELLVPSKELLTCISRSHFELLLDAPGAPLLRKLSGNPLLMDDRPLGLNEAVPLRDRAAISFGGTPGAGSGGDRRFLVLTVQLRSAQQVRAEGPHPAALAARAQAPARMPSSAVAAVLECIKTIGTDVRTLSSEARAIALPLDAPVQVGRQHQVGFFDRLLQAEPSWLTFISRTHCVVQLSHGAPPTVGAAPSSPAPSTGLQHWLKVENLSSNPVFLQGRPLVKGRADIISEGSVLTFVAKGADDKETVFLEFMLRRARACAP